LNVNDSRIQLLHKSTEWKSLPKNIKERLYLAEPAKLTSYKDSDVQVISYRMITDANYESLVFILYKSTLKPVLAKSESQGSLRYLSVSSVEGKIYYDFYVNAEDKLGKFQVHNSLTIGDAFQREGSSMRSASDPCPETSSSFGQCMLCAINECATDWICAVVCAIMSPECLIGFALACATGDYPEPPETGL